MTEAEVDAESILATWPHKRRRHPFSMAEALIIASEHMSDENTITVEEVAKAITQHKGTPKKSALPECDCGEVPHELYCTRLICHNAWDRALTNIGRQHDRRMAAPLAQAILNTMRHIGAQLPPLSRDSALLLAKCCYPHCTPTRQEDIAQELVRLDILAREDPPS